MKNTKLKNSLKKFFGLSFSNACFFGVSFFLSLYLAKEIGPEEMGFWNAANSIFIFVNLLTLGIPSGMGKEIPFYLGKENKARANDIVVTALYAMIVLISGGLLLFIILNYFFNYMSASRAIALVTLFFFQIIYGYAIVLLRSFRAFFKLSIMYLLTALLLLPIFPAIKVWQLESVIWGRAIGFFIVAAIAIFMFRASFSGKFDFKRIKPLVHTGLPVLLSGVFMALLNTVDRYIILGFLSLKDLGMYTLSIMSVTAISFLPKIASTMLYPKMSFMLGKTDDETELFPLVKQLILINTISTAAIATGIFFILPTIVHEYLPKYIPGIPAMKITLLACIILPIGLSFGDFFNITGRQKIFLTNMGVGLIANTVLGYVLVKFTNLGLSAVALGTTLGFLIFSLFQFFSFMKIYKSYRLTK